jgi:glycine cleavage system H protein
MVRGQVAAPTARAQKRRWSGLGRRPRHHAGTEEPGSTKRLLPVEGKAARRNRPSVEIDGCALPEDRLYDFENDVWWAEEVERGTARVGVLATLAAFAGPFRTFSFRPVEGTIGRGRSVATVESFRYTGAVRLPVDAVLIERNDALVRRPRLLNDAPYGDGWVVRVRAVHPEDPVRTLETASAISSRLKERIRVQRIRCWPVTPDLEMFEIGLECSAVLTKLNEELAQRPAGDAVLLVTDDPTSPIEMVRWSDQTGHRVLAHRQEGSLHQFLVRKEAHPVPRVRGG